MKKIAIIGDYNQNEESHRLIMESIKEAAEEIQGELQAQWIISDALNVSEEHLKLFDGFWFSPGSPYKDAKNVFRQFNTQGKMGCLHWVRVPVFSIWLLNSHGMC